MKTFRGLRQGLGPCLSLFAALLAAAPAGASSVWTELASPTVTPLNAVKFLNRIEGWAVGDRGTVVRFAKGKWENFPSGTDEDLLSVAVLGTGEAWAVGRNGVIVHFDGTAWSVNPQSRLLTLMSLNAVRFLTPSIGWAVGGDPGLPGIALRYNGAAWVSATTTIDALYGVEVSADDRVWFCGANRRLMQFNGASFYQFPCTPADGLAWRAMTFPYLSQGWVVGDGGVIWHYSSGAACFQLDAASGLATANLRAISMLPGSAVGMVVGDGGVRLRYNGSAFAADATGGGDLRGVDVMNELEGQAVGGTGAARIAAFRAAATETDLKRFRLYPNPLDPGRGETLKIDRLPADVDKLDIYTLRGEPVASLGNGVAYDPATGIAVWCGRIRGGKPAATGSYLLRMHSRSGKTGKGIVLVVKK